MIYFKSLKTTRWCGSIGPWVQAQDYINWPVVIQLCNPSTQEMEADQSEFRPTWDTWDLVSKNFLWLSKTFAPHDDTCLPLIPALKESRGTYQKFRMGRYCWVWGHSRLHETWSQAQHQKSKINTYLDSCEDCVHACGYILSGLLGEGKFKWDWSQDHRVGWKWTPQKKK